MSRLASTCQFSSVNIRQETSNIMSQLKHLEYKIQTQWDSRPITHDPIVLQFNRMPGGIELHVEATFFDDPKNPGGTAGQPFPNLWEHEVVEAFFLNDKTQYLELEICPHGQHLVLLLEGCRTWTDADGVNLFKFSHQGSVHGQHLILLLEGCRNAVKDKLPMEYQASINGKKWTGTAKIPAKYFPPKVTKMNCYGIHGSGEGRTYESLYPVPEGKYEQPDFHRLEYFQNINIAELLPQNDIEGSEYWTK